LNEQNGAKTVNLYEIGPLDCGYCGNNTKLTVVAQDHSQVKTYEWETQEPWGTIDNSVDRGWVHRMLICSSCGRASFDRLFLHDGYPEDMEMLYPDPIIVPDGLPPKVADEYRNALRERRRNPNGYAALLGRVLDAVCSDRGIPTKLPNGHLMFLGARLATLAKNKNLATVGGATGLRNIAAHADLRGLLPEDIPYLEALVKYILDHLYVVPAINAKAVATARGRNIPPIP
jgi:hypothetical protein